VLGANEAGELVVGEYFGWRVVHAMRLLHLTLVFTYTTISGKLAPLSFLIDTIKE